VIFKEVCVAKLKFNINSFLLHEGSSECCTLAYLFLLARDLLSVDRAV